jgi:hypothetical protein
MRKEVERIKKRLEGSHAVSTVTVPIRDCTFFIDDKYHEMDFIEHTPDEVKEILRFSKVCYAGITFLKL